MYIEHESTMVESIFDKPKRGVIIEELDNQLRRPPLDSDISPYVNRNLIHMFSRNLTK